MTRVVVDASVVVKWVFPARPGETQATRAIELLQAIQRGDVEVLQPPHWLAEAAAVVTRLDAAGAAVAIPLLYAMELPLTDDLETYRLASDLAVRLKHHLFDTLYHAVAIAHEGTTLATADEVYYRKARRIGHVIALADFAAA